MATLPKGNQENLVVESRMEDRSRCAWDEQVKKATDKKLSVGLLVVAT